MKQIKISDKEQVSQHIANLSEEIQPAIEYLRQLILSIDNEISEHIKWNSPAFYFSGDMKEFNPKEFRRDILVMNLRNDKIMCVLPTGQTIKQNTELLEGKYTDGRRIINFKDLDDIKAKEETFKNAIKEWLDLIEK
jgi:hypothetical protein